MNSYLRKGMLLVLFGVLATLPAWPQAGGTAGLNGTVTDPTGAVISGAEVKIIHEGTGATRTVTTDASGKYIFTQVAPGSYRAEVRMAGFKTSIQQKLDLLVGLTTTLNVQLEVGAIAEEVLVEAGAEALNTTDASLGVPISGREVEDLPQLDRNPAALLSLQTGVVFVPTQADSPGGYGGISDADTRSGSISGARNDQSNITLDGVDVNDPQTGYAFTSVMRVTQASLGEFRVTTTNYTSESGRSSAAQVSLVTKSGTNDIHGEAYWLHRNEAFNANEFFLNRAEQKEGKFRRHLYGGALGGPIVKDRFFLFGNYERLEESLFDSAERTVPSEAFRDGVFIYRCRNLDKNEDGDFLDPGETCPATPNTVTGLSGATYTPDPGFWALSPADITQLDPCFPAGTCLNPDGSVIQPGPNAASLANWANFPLPNTTGSSGDPFNVPGYRFAAPVDNTFNTYIARADFNITRDAKHMVFWRGTLMDDVVVGVPQFLGQPPSQSNLVASKGMAVGYTAILSPTVVNRFTWGLTRLKEQTAGLQAVDYVDFRFISNDQDYESDSLGRTIPQNHVRDDVSWTIGKHTYTFGGELRWTRLAKFGNANSFHFFTVNPSWINDGGRQIVPGLSNCVQATTLCDTLPVPAAGRQFRDFLTQIYSPITQVNAAYNFDNTGATLPHGEAVRRNFATDEYEFYFQDQWRATPAFTLTLGIRYFVASPPWETNGNQVVPTPSLSDYFTCRQRQMLAGQPTANCGIISIDLGGPVNNGDDYYRWDWNNWSPRVALAWAPRYTDGILGTIFGDGKLAIRAGYSLVYDRVGNALVTDFDEYGSFGMATNITSKFGGCAIGPLTLSATDIRPACVRFSGVFDTAPATGQSLVASPGGGFPTVPPTGLLTVANSIDDSMVTPYAHTLNFSIARELPWDLSVEGSYVWRRGLHLLLQRDYAMPANWTSPDCGVTVWEAENAFLAYAEQNAGLADYGFSTIPASCFWETHFPSFAAGSEGTDGGCYTGDVDNSEVGNAGCLGFDAFGVATPVDTDGDGVDDAFAGGFSATQVAYDYVMGYHGLAPAGGTVTDAASGFGASTIFQDIDYFGFPGYMNCAAGTDLNGDGLLDCPNSAYTPQYVELTVWNSVSRSEYHAFQMNVRKRMSHGVQFNLNYTLSKSRDHGSTPERTYPGGGAGIFAGYSGYALNSWELDRVYSYSDYDMRHQLNAYWTADLPFGRGRAFGGDWPGWVNQILGGWQLSGIFRYNSGLPANAINGRTWPTNWDYQGNPTCAPVGTYPFGQTYGPCPATQNVHESLHGGDPASSSPNIFADPDAALLQFRFTEPGGTGNRNILRGDSYMNLDFGIAKHFNMPWEGHLLEFRWDMFNLTNSVYFDTGSMSMSIEDPDTFGDYTGILGAPRRMQVTLRYVF